MKANSEKTKQSNKATRRVLAGVLCGASVLSLVLSLVMPPISQAIANGTQEVAAEEVAADEGTLSKDARADNPTGKDAENQNNGDVENDANDDVENGANEDTVAADSTADDAEAEGAAPPADDDANDEGTIALAAENGSTHEISSGAELSSKLSEKRFRDNEGRATFTLVNNIECRDEISLNQTDDNPINITLNLNGNKIKCLNTNKPLFNVAGGATLTIMDSKQESEKVNEGQPLTDRGQSLNADNYDKYAANYGKNANLTYDKDNDNIPSNLTYYVTESSPNETGTTETLVKHDVEIKGAIVACGGKTNLRLINLYNRHGKGGTFNLVSGVITQKQDGSVSSLVYAEGGSTVNMRGGYVCGALGSGAGAGIMVSNDNGGASTLNLTGGVIAGNRAPRGGGVYAKGSAVTVTSGVISGKVTSGVISGNSTLGAELGGGIMAEGGIVTVSGGYITNNRMAKFCGNDGWGCHGGAGLAANNGAHVTISGGQITGNYSEEAGGGVYVTNQDQQGMAWLDITGGIIASNVSFRSEGAGIRVGQKVDAEIKVPANSSSPVYITNNSCMSRFDWGGGGVFVQGCNEDASKAGRLFVYSSYISSNTAGGYGGGVAVCPTGKTLVTNTEGTAIFGNKSADDEHPSDNHPNPAYDKASNSGNEKAPHLSAGGAEGTNKTEDRDAYDSETFRTYGHADFFLAANGHTTPVAVVSGKMLGDIDAKYSGSIELTNRITIPANGVAQVKNSIGLTSGVSATDETKTEPARNKATTFITGNYSWDHGGGIMSNGDLYLGQPADTYVYPSLKLKATKELTGRDLKDKEFTFTVYRKDSDNAKAPSWDNNGNFSNGGCEPVKSVPNSADGNIAFDLSAKLSELLGKQFKASGTGETTDYDITYYMVENAGDKLGVKYDHAVYEIKVKVKCTPTELMSVPIHGKPNETKKLMVYNYAIDRVDVTKHDEGSAKDLGTVSLGTDGYYSIVDSSSATSTNKATFTNTYDSEGSWTPKATKVVKGGEMKAFTLQLATDYEFNNIVSSKSTTAGGNDDPQTLSFADIGYKLNQLDKLEPDSTGRVARKVFPYYVREQQPNTPFTNCTYDKSVYEFKVDATDYGAGKITTNVTYTQIVDAKGKPIPENEQSAVPYVPDKDEATGKEQSVPVFTNTYSTSLPLSGMSGVTLTYLAGAAVLCAAAAWMHIRRKANAKGGKRRE